MLQKLVSPAKVNTRGRSSLASFLVKLGAQAPICGVFVSGQVGRWLFAISAQLAADRRPPMTQLVLVTTFIPSFFHFLFTRQIEMPSAWRLQRKVEQISLPARCEDREQ